jgi:hypothetical protein
LQGALDERENEVDKVRKKQYLLHDYQLLNRKFYFEKW